MTDPSRSSRTSHFVAADVGGTNARIGLVVANGDQIRIDPYREYRCADYPRLGAILAEFIDSLSAVRVDDIVIGLPGYAQDGVVVERNLPWRVAIADLRAELGIQSISWLNDFAAVAHSVPWIDPAQTVVVAAGAGRAMSAPILIVGPGTGLGAALSLQHQGRPLVLATEAGQSAFAPNNDLEIEILRILRRKTAHVSVEMLTSGPGLMNLYGALCELRGEPSSMQTPTEVSDAAASGTNAVASETLDLFCGILGSVVGDLVMSLGAQGGVYLAGGILPKIRAHLLASNFSQRFVDRGVMRQVLERVPVRLVEHGQLGIIGAAHWHLDQSR